jgi:hypothetical protein
MWTLRRIGDFSRCLCEVCGCVAGSVYKTSVFVFCEVCGCVAGSVYKTSVFVFCEVCGCVAGSVYKTSVFVFCHASPLLLSLLQLIKGHPYLFTR